MMSMLPVRYDYDYMIIFTDSLIWFIYSHKIDSEIWLIRLTKLR